MCRSGKDEKLTLNTALDIARTQEATEADMRLLHGQAVNVDVTKQHIQRKKQCSFCGLNHPPRKCPAYGTKCRNCDKMITGRSAADDDAIISYCSRSPLKKRFKPGYSI